MDISKIINYLDDSLGQIENFGEIETDNYPLYIKGEYSLQWVKILDKKFVLAMKSTNEEQNIDKLLSRRRKLNDLLGKDTSVIFVFESITDYMRKRLMEEQLAFVIPGKQIFILEIGTVFTDRINSKYSVSNSIEVKKMSPSAQALLLYLLSNEDVRKSMKDIAAQLEMSQMSVSRGFRELKNLKLVEFDFDYVPSFHRLSASKEEIWKMSFSFMSNPVRKTIYVNKSSLPEEIRKLLVVSGESALSEYSMLSEPKHKVMGLYDKDYTMLFKGITIIPIKEMDTLEIQIFNHSMPSHNGVLTELSTALTLIDEIDERVKGELDDMLTYYFRRKN